MKTNIKRMTTDKRRVLACLLANHPYKVDVNRIRHWAVMYNGPKRRVRGRGRSDKLIRRLVSKGLVECVKAKGQPYYKLSEDGLGLVKPIGITALLDDWLYDHLQRVNW